MEIQAPGPTKGLIDAFPSRLACPGLLCPPCSRESQPFTLIEIPRGFIMKVLLA